MSPEKRENIALTVNVEELKQRIRRHLEDRPDSETMKLLWKGYLSGLMEWGLFQYPDEYSYLMSDLGDIGKEESIEIALGTRVEQAEGKEWVERENEREAVERMFDDDGEPKQWLLDAFATAADLRADLLKYDHEPEWVEAVVNKAYPGIDAQGLRKPSSVRVQLSNRLIWFDRAGTIEYELEVRKQQYTNSIKLEDQQLSINLVAELLREKFPGITNTELIDKINKHFEIKLTRDDYDFNQQGKLFLTRSA